MGIDIFPKAWSVIPPPTAKAIQGHPLCPKFGFVCNDGIIKDLVTGLVGVPSQAGTPPSNFPAKWSPGSIRGYAGTRVLEHDTTYLFDRLGDGNLLLPNNNITFVCGYQKTDATLRNARAFGGEVATSAGFIVTAYLPWQDGTVYWDWSDQSSGRLSVGGLSFGNDIWVLTTGPRAQEIWQNGILRATKSPAPAKGTYGAGTEQVALGKATSGSFGVDGTSDFAKYMFLYIYWRQLSEKEIAEITAFPFCWVEPRS